MDPAHFASAFALVFLAELGDKTQLTAMALATRYPWRRAFLGIAAAFAVLNIVAVAVGSALFQIVPLEWIKLASAALFLFFGVATLRASAEQDGESRKNGREYGPFLTSFLLILFAELGDKTQLATAGLAAQSSAPLAVFAGSTLALWAVSLLGLLVGARLTRVLPARRVHLAAGLMFLVFGLALLWQARGIVGLN